MDNIVELGETWDDCPTSWHNFITELWSHHTERGGYKPKRINKLIIKELAKYNARVDVQSLMSNRFTVLEFSTPADKTWFTLKWH